MCHLDISALFQTEVEVSNETALTALNSGQVYASTMQYDITKILLKKP